MQKTLGSPCWFSRWRWSKFPWLHTYFHSGSVPPSTFCEVTPLVTPNAESSWCPSALAVTAGWSFSLLKSARHDDENEDWSTTLPKKGWLTVSCWLWVHSPVSFHEHQHSTRGRQQGDFRPFQPASLAGRISFTNRAPLLWNMLPREVQTSSSMLVFKKNDLSLLAEAY